jgi:hypothetical protein
MPLETRLEGKNRMSVFIQKWEKHGVYWCEFQYKGGTSF